ncbi:hypothetical protein H8959_019324 [Pygathrix nigripes]
MVYYTHLKNWKTNKTEAWSRLLCFTNALLFSPKDIKYIEVTSARSRCHDGPQRCSSPSVTPPFGSPRSGGLFLSRDVPRETRSSSESLIFSGNQGRGHQRPLPPSEGLSPQPPNSPSISIPCMGSKASSPHGLGSPLVASPRLEKRLGGLAPQRGSRDLHAVSQPSV